MEAAGSAHSLLFWPKPFAAEAERTDSASVDTALPAYKLVQKLGSRLVDGGVTQGPAAFAPSSFVGLGRVGSAGASEFIHLPPAPSNHEGAVLLRRPGVHVAAPV